MEYILISLFLILSLVFIYLYFIEKEKLKKYETLNKNYIEKYNGLELLNNNINNARSNLNKVFEKEKSILKQASDKKTLIEKSILENNNELNNIKSEKNKILKELSLYNEAFNYFEYGIYEPIFKHDDNEKYKNEIKKSIDEQKSLLKDNKAIINKSVKYPSETKAEHNKRITSINKNVLSVFNLEADNIMNSINPTNYNKLIERFTKTYETLNKNNSINDIHSLHISQRYFYAKKNEIISKFKYEEAKFKIKQEQDSIKAQMREEERESKIIEREREKALKIAQKAQSDEDKFNEELKKAQEDLKNILEADFNKKMNLSHIQSQQMKTDMEQKIAALQLELNQAAVLKTRSLSMAQQTKKGYIYVISNVGSFGENIYKIGMTRRIEPMDRIKELSNASVPFEFDVHAMIYSEDAPALEKELHNNFVNYRVNLVNLRKEFFRIELSEIENYLNSKNVNHEMIITSLARDFHETSSIKISSEKSKKPISSFLNFMNDEPAKEINKPIEEKRRSSIFS